MDARDARLMLEYDRAMNRRVLDAAAEVTPEEYAATSPGLSFGSLHGALVHVLAAELVWLARWRGTSPQALITAEELPTFEAVRARWQEHDSELEAFAAGLEDADLARVIEYGNTSGQPFSNPLSELVLHVVNHGTQFRTEAAVRLTTLGRSPGNLDLIAYLRAR